MAFVPGFDHDIFISYAHVNDRPYLETMVGRERSTGWVSTLFRLLKNALAETIGRDDAFTIWFDNVSLRGNHRLTDEIAEKLEHSANLLAVLSPGYAASQWCKDEARLFAGRLDTHVRNSVFVVEMAPVLDAEAVPPELRGLRNYRFWYRDRTEQVRTFARPAPHAEELEYFRLIEDLARDLHRQLIANARGVSANGHDHPSPSSPNAAAPPAIFLAEVTDDLGPRRAEVQRYLEQQGFAVLPASPYPRDTGDLAAALSRELGRSQLFVQLLGPFAGSRSADFPDGYGWTQFEAARNRGIAILQWRSPETDPDKADLPRQRELLEMPTVQASSLESFKSAIVSALAAPAAAPQPRPNSGDRPLIFLNTEPRHRPIAAQIRNTIGDRAEWAEPLIKGPAEVVREDLEQNLIDCDAMVMVYADNAPWARAQLRQFRKISPRRERPVRAIPVIVAPPAEEPDLGMTFDGLVMIDGRHGIGPDAYDRLSQSLHL